MFVLTTKPAELVEDLEQAGFSPKIGYVISSVFQIVPQMSGTMNTIMDAQRSRGLETEGNLITRAKSFLPLISPVVMSSLINTRERAIALEIRGFEAGQKKTCLREGKNENFRPRVMSGDGCGDCRGYSGEDCAVNRHLLPKLKMCIVKAGKK